MASPVEPITACNAAAVTKSDTTDVLFNAVYVGGAGALKFNANAGQSITAAGKWNSDGVTVNKSAGYFTADGTVKVACNGALGSTGSGGTVEATLDHFDLSTNGAGSNSLYSWTRRFAMSPNLAFTDAELIAMTT